MSLPNYLAKIKSSGIYRFVWDKSQVTATEAETLRLVVGYSEKGPFNTPVYIDNPGDFKTTFGDVNKKLEKRGVFFHRMALQALAGGPILALNVKKFGNEQVEYVGGNVSAKFEGAAKAAVEKVFNTSRFWTLDPDSLPSNLGTEYGKYITITSTDSKDSSNTIFMRGCTPSGYDVTIKTWYSSSTDEEMPAYMEGYEDMLLSDFFAEIFVFKGKFTPALAKTEELKKYFDVIDGKVTLKPYLVNAFGEKVDTLTALSENECSNFVQRYQGILIPYFKNINGAYISLDLLFNADNDLHKMMMKLNSDFLDDGGYYASATATDLTPFTMKNITTRGYDKLTVADIDNAIKVAAGKTTDYTSSIDFMSNTAIIPHVVVGSYGDSWSFVGDDYVTTPDLYVYNAKTAVTAEGGVFTLGTEFKEAGLAEGDRILVKVGDDVKLVTISEVIESDENIKIATTDENAEPIVSTSQVVPHEDGKVCIAIDCEGVSDIVANALVLDGVKGADAGTYRYWLVEPADSVVIAGDAGYQAVVTAKTDHAIKYTDKTDTDLPVIDQNTTVIVKATHILTEDIATMSPLYLEGYTKENEKPANSTVEAKLKWQKDHILAAINTDSSIGYPGLVEALTNRKDIDYRYIVDTFESFVDAELKASLALLAKKKDNAVLLTNFPAIQTFIKSTACKFTDKNGAFQMKYVKDGGNRQKGAAFFSLPSIDNGASWCSFNTPVVFSDGVVKTTVPAAALVSNNFMAKYSGRQPYYIVAGPNYGRLSYPGMVGPDYNFSRADLDILEPMGVNATVFVLRKGTFISSNQTAKQTPVSALSKLNVRELVIYLQDQIEDLLQNYQWEFNTQPLRDLVKAKADTICQNVKANGGIYDFNNQCDEKNNNDDVINNEMFVLSTSIEPGMGSGKMVQELTIYKKGGMRAVIS
jgi:hypothetical protein